MKQIYLLIILLVSFVGHGQTNSEVFKETFGTPTAKPNPYAGAPTKNALITAHQWSTTSTDGFESSNTVLTPGVSNKVNIIINLKLTIAPGQQFAVSSLSFDRGRDSKGPENLTINFNDIPVQTLGVPTAITPTGQISVNKVFNTELNISISLEPSESNGNNAKFRLDNFILNGRFEPKTSTGQIFTYDDRETPAWEPYNPIGTSNNGDDFFINFGNAVITANTNARNVAVSKDAALTINPGVKLITNKLTLASTSTQYSSLISYSNNAVEGNISYQLFVNHGNEAGKTNGNDLISPPLSGQFFNAFQANNTIIKKGKTKFLFGTWNQSTSTYENFLLANNDLLVTGKGYRAAVDSETVGNVLTFTGTPFTQILNVPISKTGTSRFSDWNLLGNPYPAYIDIKAFYDEVIVQHNNASKRVKNIDLIGGEEGLTSGIYGYNDDTPTGNSYTVYTLDYLNDNPNRAHMAPGQGFFVTKNTTFEHDIKFNPSMSQ